MSSENNEPRPPQPPEFQRKLQLYPFQYILIPLLFLIPVLAILGFFGETVAIQSANNPSLSVQVEYWSRTRHKVGAPLKVRITNQTDSDMTDINVHFDRDYIDAFLWLSFLPTVTSVTDEDYIVTIDDLPAGQTQAVTVDLKAEKIGVISGTVTIEAETIEPISVRLESLLFP